MRNTSRGLMMLRKIIPVCAGACASVAQFESTVYCTNVLKILFSQASRSCGISPPGNESFVHHVFEISEERRTCQLRERRDNACATVIAHWEFRRSARSVMMPFVLRQIAPTTLCICSRRKISWDRYSC